MSSILRHEEKISKNEIHTPDRKKQRKQAVSLDKNIEDIPLHEVT